MSGRLSTLRWRLTLLYAGVTSLLLIVLGLFLSSQAESFLVDAEAARLRDLIRPALSKPGPPGRPENNLTRVADKLSQSLTGTSVEGMVLDVGGKPVSPPGRPGATLAGSILPGVPYESVLATGREYTVIVPTEAERMLLLVTPVGPDGNTAGLVQAGASLQQVDSLLDRLRALLMLGIGTVLATALLVVFPFVRLMLRPLDRLVDNARRIAEGNLGLRASVPHGDDEVGRLAAAFDQMLDRIEAAFQAREDSEARTKQFAADASHELRSPLTALGGYTDVLLRGARDDPQTAERVLRSMRREIDRMSRLISDLLTLTRLDAGKELRFSDADLSVIAAEAGKQAQLMADGCEISIQTDASLVINGDPDRLRQVVTNLLDNALRHTPVGGRIELEAAGLDGRARLIVRDTGPGIASEHLPYIFERFYRVDHARSRDTGSSGLGLAIVRAIVEAHGGEVRVTSRPGRGAEFVVDLPLTSARP